MKAEDVMTTKVITVTENQTKQEAARLLAEQRQPCPGQYPPAPGGSG